MRFLQAAVLITAFASLAGCAASSLGFGLLAASTSVVVMEDKLPTDLLAEYATGKDCNAIRRMEDKGPLCRSPARIVEYIEPLIYCYRTLGAVECYDRPDPYNTGASTIE